MITSSSLSGEKAGNAPTQTVSPTSSDSSVKKSRRADEGEKTAVKVEISPEGRALSEKKMGRKEKEAAEALKTREEKEDELVKFYAKRLAKATKELDKEAEDIAKKDEAEAAFLEASDAKKTEAEKPSSLKLPTT